jgi:SSS family solute:Na+ symporter
MHVVSSVFVFVAYALVLTFVAVRARAARKFSEFSLARRALPLALVFGSLSATYVGPGFSIGFVGKGFNSGFLFLAIGVAYAVQNVLVGLLVAPRLRGLKDCHTLGDAIGQKYDKKCQVMAGVISVGLCAGFAAVMAKAGGDVLENVFRLPPWSGVMIVVGITALYTTFGGLRASVITDAFQFTAFAILLPLTLVLILVFHVEGGMATFAAQASAATREGFASISTIQIVGLVAAFLLGETLIPPYANRALASKTTRTARNGFVLAGMFSLVWFTVMFSLGIAARAIVAAGTKEDHVLLNLVKSTMPTEGYVLLLVVLLSVIMSSLDSLLNAGAVSFAEDIIKPFRKPDDIAMLGIGRCTTIAIAFIAAAGALVVPQIIEGLLVCYTVWAPAILPALVIGLWAKHPRPLAGILSMASGTLVAVMFEFNRPSFLFKVVPQSVADIPAIFPALAAAILAYLIGHTIDKLLRRD